jgi:hypothetical protein
LSIVANKTLSVRGVVSRQKTREISTQSTYAITPRRNMLILRGEMKVMTQPRLYSLSGDVAIAIDNSNEVVEVDNYLQD